MILGRDCFDLGWPFGIWRPVRLLGHIVQPNTQRTPGKRRARDMACAIKPSARALANFATGIAASIF